MDWTEAQSLITLVDEVSQGLDGLDVRRSLERLEGHFQDLEPVFGWLLEHRPRDALKMACQLAEFTRLTGRISDGRSWLDRALAAADDQPLRPLALYENGMLAFWQGDDRLAQSLHEASLELARNLNDRTSVAVALCGLARIALRRDGGLDGARALCEEALETVRDTDDTKGRSNALHLLGVIAQMMGDLDTARGFMNQRLELAKRLGNFRSVASEAANLGVVERQLGNLERAQSLAMESLELSWRRGDEWMLPYAFNGLAAIAVERRQYERAATLLGAAEAQMARQGTAWPPDERPHFERSRQATTDRLEPEAFHKAWARGHGTPAGETVTWILDERRV